MTGGRCSCFNLTRWIQVNALPRPPLSTLPMPPLLSSLPSCTSLAYMYEANSQLQHQLCFLLAKNFLKFSLIVFNLTTKLVITSVRNTITLPQKYRVHPNPQPSTLLSLQNPKQTLEYMIGILSFLMLSTFLHSSFSTS